MIKRSLQARTIYYCLKSIIINALTTMVSSDKAIIRDLFMVVRRILSNESKRLKVNVTTESNDHLLFCHFTWPRGGKPFCRNRKVASLCAIPNVAYLAKTSADYKAHML